MIELNSYRRESLKRAKILPFRFSPFFLVSNFCHGPDLENQWTPLGCAIKIQKCYKF